MSSHATDYAPPVYQPTAASLAQNLPIVGESLSNSLAELARDPTPARCDLMVQKLTAADHAVARLRASLIAEASQ